MKFDQYSMRYYIHSYKKINLENHKRIDDSFY